MSTLPSALDPSTAPPSESQHVVSGAQPLRGLQRAQLALGGLRYTDLVVAEVQGSVGHADLERAARALATRHPVLRSRITDDPKVGFVIEPVPRRDLPVTLGIGPWRAAAEEILARPLGGGGPPWCLRAVVADDRFHLLLAVHHALVDGRSLSRLLRDLLTALDAPSALGPSLEPPPALLDVAVPPRWARWTAPLLRRIWASRLRRLQKHTPLPGRRLAPGEPIPIVFTGRALEDGVVPEIRETARAHGATVGGALAAAAWSATAAMARRRGVPDAISRRLPIETMVDLRGQVDGLPEVGMYAGGALALSGADVPLDAGDRARMATGRVRDQVAWGVPLMAHHLADPIDDLVGWLRSRRVDLDDNGGTGAVAQVSNAGPWSGPVVFGSRRLVAVWSAAAPVRGGPVVMTWLRTVEGRGYLTAIGNGAVVTSTQVERWLEDVDLCLRGFASDRPVPPIFNR